MWFLQYIGDNIFINKAKLFRNSIGFQTGQGHTEHCNLPDQKQAKNK